NWIVAFWHHPPYSKGSHDSDKEGKLIEMREQALPLLEAGGVDLVLSGHSHAYERSILLDGHYGKSATLIDGMKKDKGDGRVDGDGAYKKAHATPTAHEGAVYVVAGSSGKHDGGALNHKAMFLALDELGSMVIDINGNCLDATFLEPGKVGDTFRIIKGGNGKDTTPPVLVAAARVDAAHVDLAFSEKLDPKTAEDPKLYGLYPVGAVGQAPLPPRNPKLLLDGQTVRLEQPGMDGVWKSWTASANGVTDRSGNVADAKPKIEFPIAIPAQANIPFGSTWKYDASGTDLADAWLKPDFDDSKWPGGPGQFGYGDDDEATRIPKDTIRPSYYFRKKITLAGKPTAAKLTIVHDDGVIVWINGKRTFSKYADNGIAYSALASKASEDNETSQTDIGLNPSPFVDGENIICVMIKQVGLDSSDISFDIQLDLTLAP
ncbi:MAG TPA: metallophosphoesterase, partial [Planctomycetota bacterium]|nr:metallophosphoesterase [Planctomycetota bacterium]